VFVGKNLRRFHFSLQPTATPVTTWKSWSICATRIGRNTVSLRQEGKSPSPRGILTRLPLPASPPSRVNLPEGPAVDFLMGHESPHTSSVYRERFGDARLMAVTDHVCTWLFSPARLPRLPSRCSF
jgi:hypothetical protein